MSADGSPSPARTAAQALVDGLRLAGTDRVFCVPGESYLAVLDALVGSGIDLISCRHESGAGLMAVADAKLTHRPGVALVSRGPGAGNATLAVHVAQQDAVPLILIVGQAETENLGRGAFQEVDYVKTFSDMAKWVVEVRDPARIPEFIARAWHEAMAGTPGPVVLSLPEDVLTAACATPAFAPALPRTIRPAPEDLDAALALLAGAERPVLLAGGLCEPQQTRAALLAFAEAQHVPVFSTNKHQTVFPNDHRLWMGHIGYLVPPGMAQVLARADLILAIGTRLGDISSQGFRFPRAPLPDQPLIHAYPDPHVPGRVIRPTLGLTCHPAPLLTGLATRGPTPVVDRTPWIAALAAARDTLAATPVRRADDGLDFGAVVGELSARLPDDAIVTVDAGNFASWLHAYTCFGPRNDLIGAVGGAMGLGVPAAVAASLRHPDRPVICIVGDGGLLMTGNELATALQYGAKPVIILADNRSYGAIRAHQEGHYPGRISGTDLINPDFTDYATAFGARPFSIREDADIAPVLARALACGEPAVVHVATSLNLITAYRRLDG